MPEMLFYTIREYGITVCLIKAVGGFWARGVAICSKRDQFWKARGREIAQGRAEKVLGSAARPEPLMHICPIMRGVTAATMQMAGFAEYFKASMSCMPAHPIEEKLLKAKNWV